MSDRRKSKGGKLVTDGEMARRLTICTWCERDLDERLVTLPCKSPPELARALEEHTVPVLVFRLATAGGRRVVAMLPARQDGGSIGFATCSEACCTALRAALHEELRSGGSNSSRDQRAGPHEPR